MSARELQGAAVVVLRAGEGPDAVADELERHGAVVATLRVAHVVDRADGDVLGAVGALERFGWVAVTSANAARRLALFSAQWPAATRVAVVGPATAAAVESLGLHVDAVASGGTAADLARSIEAGPVLFLAAANARGDVARELTGRGIEVTTVVAYDVEAVPLDTDAVALLLDRGVVVAMAPSAIDALHSMDEQARRAARSIPLVAFGPSTQRRAEALDWPIAAVATRRDPQAVTDAVRAALGR